MTRGRGMKPNGAVDATTVAHVSAYLAAHCHDPRHPRTNEWHAKAHARNAKEIVALCDRLREPLEVTEV